MCAVAFESWQMGCRFDQNSSENDSYQSAKLNPDEGPPVDHKDISMFDKTRWLPDQCPAPLTFEILDKTVTWNFDPYCNTLKLMGQILVAISLLGAAIVVVKGIQ